MANRYLNGFDDLNTASLAYEAGRLQSTPEIATALNGLALKLVGASTFGTSEGWGITCMPEGQAEFYLGFRRKVANIVDSLFVSVGDSVNSHLLLYNQADGTFALARSAQSAYNAAATSSTVLGTSTATISEQDELFIELSGKIDDAAGGTGWAKVHLNGNPTPIIDIAVGADTRNAGAGLVTHFWMNCNGNAQISYVDDVYMNDATGTDCNGRMGDMRVDSHFVTADGANTGWDNNASPPDDDYKAVDDPAPDVTNYIYTLTLNAKSTFDFENFKNNGADIEAIQVTAIARKSDAGTCGLKFLSRESGVDTLSATALYPSTSWTSLRDNFSIASDDPKRNAAGFNAAEWGAQKVA